MRGVIRQSDAHHMLLGSAQYRIDTRVIEGISNNLSIFSTILNLISFKDECFRSSVTNMFWYDDTGDGGEETSNIASAGEVISHSSISAGDAIKV
ncbi:hypothetical protein CHS0354_031176 [Potamilus streckersoni]|uniref:Uncharacterized protein n=1 Tax=Potamilus streckersoni TaxID=2493646 RepID=A0AAE0WEX5_9BIVA|nr:hypothetical protein CHS0354_031176 [Potamilus streckersoni]